MIVVKTQDAYLKEFETLLSNVSDKIMGTSGVASGEAFEKYLCSRLDECAKGTSFENSFEITSKLAFPDIISKIEQNNWIGIEVKTSKNDWKCFGNSIFETSRIDNVQNIFLFFAKINSSVECKWGKYSDCIENINITHSPRYHINMDLLGDETKCNVFSLMGVCYDDFRNKPHSERMEFVRKLKREQVGKDVALWWLPNSEEEEGNDKKLSIRLLKELDVADRNKIIATSLILFPELYKKTSNTKYFRLVKWLVSNFGIVSHSIRDEFSAGGQIDIEYLGRQYKVPRIFERVEFYKDDIKNMLEDLSYADISEYWDCVNIDISDNKINDWFSIVTKVSQDTKAVSQDFPLKEWLKTVFNN